MSGSEEQARYRYVVTAPGQGVQRAGMLDPWLEAVPGAPELVDRWSRAAGFDIESAGRDATLLADTAFAQPLIVAASLLSLRLLCGELALDAGDVLYAGHSVGELAAAAGAGCLDASAAVGLARVRGARMSAACAAAPTGMAAVMPTRKGGAGDEELTAAVTAAGLTVANWNGSHQFVAAGPAERVQALAESPAPGMRVAPLAVAGAFHTGAMAPAVPGFARAAREAGFTRPASAMVANGDGALISGPDDLRRRLVAQITSPVRWDLCGRTIERLAPDALHIELAPAGPLTRLLQRSRPDARAVALATPEDVGRAVEQARAAHEERLREPAPAGAR
ncbi:ACP S-malonyltransferase [Streptomyces fuscigenes]|uniref:ACP S-malonyltransferase n=1 Tax=Streptomyces fuscigenes TaxID=1528880 RepID=UPI001F3F56B1|nr:ACP S-malonyltransferase [Streptomyces fuscigenes]MCF3960682.1 ACP S-malonyltransferase [Streptomyces fuscigenes]